MANMLTSSAAKNTLKKVEHVSSLIKSLIENDPHLDKNREEIQQILDRELQNDEYFVIVDSSGMS
ncbi:hypothetical protein KHA80_22850 [Anaerobacillus sp. HL2]|nr:hypothetical protein KHA80_22850 [Anaerobacillus sp. HL2]